MHSKEVHMLPMELPFREVTQPSSESVWVGVTPGSGRRGRCGARNAVTPPGTGTDRGAGCLLPASRWKGSPAHSSMPATAALELNMARILIFFVV